MKTPERKENVVNCIEFTKNNLSECANELLEWKRTAILKHGKLRELAQMISVWSGEEHCLKLAESFICDEALKAVSTHYIDRGK